VRVSFALAQTTDVAVSLPKMPLPMIPERNKLVRKMEIRRKKPSAWYSYVRKFKIFEKFPLQAAGRFVEYTTGEGLAI